MTWFQVDDGFYSHPKVLSIPRSVRATAIGTWTLAGTWCADKLTDGYIVAHMVEEIGGSLDGAEALVAARLWRRRGAGFVFVNWSEFQLTRDQVEARKKAERDRKAEYRAKKPGNSRVSPEGVPAGQTRDSEPPILSSSYPTPPLTDDQSSGELTGEQPGPGLIHPQGVSNSVGNGVDLERIVARVRELTGRDIHPLTASAIGLHYLDRAKTPPRMATRYVVTCLNAETPAVLANYLDTDRWSE